MIFKFLYFPFFNTIYNKFLTFIIIMLRIQNLPFVTVLVFLSIGFSVEAENAIVDPPYTENVQEFK